MPFITRCRSALTVSALLAPLLGACDEPTAPPLTVPPAAILLIGDGMGDGAIGALRLSSGPLAMEALPVRATVLTSSASHDITDSGAAAPAMATGVATANRSIGVDAAGVPVPTLLEVAETLGWATALVATSSVTHATPAAFAAHVADRAQQHDIARQMALSGVDVLLGGGLRYFQPGSRPDALDLVQVFENRGCRVWLEPAALTTPAGTCALALLADHSLPPAGERIPDLRDLTVLALQILDRDADGFFLMVEGSQIDWAAHDNDGPAVVAEMADFDQAVAAVVAFAQTRGNVTLVTTGDHETGGLTAHRDEAGDSLAFDFASTGHTAQPVPLVATGPATDRLPDTLANHELGTFLMENVRLRGTAEHR